MSEGAQLSPSHIAKLQQKAKELGYEKLIFFIDDLDMLLRPTNLLKAKDMKYFELENLITLLNSKNISLGMAPRMISMVSKYSERNEELENENSELKKENITFKSKFQTAEAQIAEYQKQLENLSVGQRTDAKIKEENIKLTEENKYLKMTNESLTEDLKSAKKKLDDRTEEANDLEVENSQMELRIKDLQKDLRKIEKELQEEQSKEKGTDTIKAKIEEIIEELDELYETIDDPFKKEFLAFFGLELSEIIDNRTITKQKILNQIAHHAREIEKIFEPQLTALTQRQMAVMAPRQTITQSPTAAQKPVATTEKPTQKTKTKAEHEKSPLSEDSYVKPSDVLKAKGIEPRKKVETASAEGEPSTTEGQDGAQKEELDIPKPVISKAPVKKKKKKKRKGASEEDRTPSPELVKVFDVFIKYLDAINDNKNFNALCDKIIDELYGHIGSNGMTQVYKIKSGGVKRKPMLISLLKKWKVTLPDL